MAIPGKASAPVPLQLDLLSMRTYKTASEMPVSSAFSITTKAQVRIDF